MTTDQTIVFGVLLGALLLFAWGRWRYDVVAVLALLAVVLAGIVPADEAFTGFGHPAVVTVAAVLVISRALQNAGVMDVVMGLLQPMRGRPDLQMGAQTGLIAVLSALMNNVGALALLMPVALRNAYREGYAPAKSLMPLAFGSLLGGLVTLIGTPPNIIVSAMRQEAVGEPFRMFDFAPVGLAVAGVGVLFVVLVGWRLIPKARRDAPAGDKGFDIGDYLLEGLVTEDSRAVGRTIEELEAQHEDARVLGIARSEHRHLLPGAGETVRVDDVLILQGDPEALQQFIAKAGLSLVEGHTLSRADVRSDEIELSEVIVKHGSVLTGKTPKLMRLRTIYRVNLLGVARHGRRPDVRLRDVRFQPGDVLLLQGAQPDLDSACAALGCIPLAERTIGIGRPRKLVLATGAFAAAIGMVIAGLLPVHLAFMLAVVALVLAGAVRLDELYASIDWPVLVLLGAMLPVGGALEATGGTVLVADTILSISAGLEPVWVLTLLLVSTMMLSDVINNNATAVLMAPIALTLAARLDVNPDAFLMAVAIGASCAFLTPIGHQSNTLVLVPGGYRFGDYWRMGLPLEVVITIVAVPLLLRVWPL